MPEGLYHSLSLHGFLGVPQPIFYTKHSKQNNCNIYLYIYNPDIGLLNNCPVKINDLQLILTADGIHFHDSEYQSMDGMNLNENNGYQDPVTRNVNTRNPMLNLDASIIPDNNNANDSLSHTGVYTPPVVPNANETFITGV
mmetsp:Transcript_1875/g.2422  ORF Transcript_1875/g.2422 Transcript_1875/m.2422 type:complete len:141 (+) Transcript_1875:498-920(+)